MHGFGSLAHHYKDIILITDGGDHESYPLEAAKAAADQQVSIYAIGIGDPHRGTRIPVQNARGARAYMQYQGQDVRSRLQEGLLLEMAQLTGGAYIPAGTRAMELDRIYSEKIAPKARRDLDVAARERDVHRYQWFVLAALLLLSIEMLMCERKIDYRAEPR